MLAAFVNGFIGAVTFGAITAVDPEDRDGDGQPDGLVDRVADMLEKAGFGAWSAAIAWMLFLLFAGGAVLVFLWQLAKTGFFDKALDRVAKFNELLFSTVSDLLKAVLPFLFKS